MKIDELLIPLIVLALLALIGFIVLNVIQKKNRQYERKAILWYLVISLLLFFILGLTGLLSTNSSGILISQVIAFCFGVFHVWFIFSNYDWPDRKAFLPTSILTLAISTTAGLGFVLGLWFWHWLFEGSSLVSSVYGLVFLIPLPYLFVRTYHFIMQIPPKEYVAWVLPETSAENLNFSEKNVIYVNMTLFTKSSKHMAGKISNLRSAMPKDTIFGVFFQRFLKDYNESKHTNYPITNLHQNEEGQKIGWLFYHRRTEKGRKILIDPFAGTLDQLQEGDFVYAHRVLLGKSYTKSNASFTINPRSSSHDDSDQIIITEK